MTSFMDVPPYDETKEQLLTGIERGSLRKIMDGRDLPPNISCTNDAHCKKYDPELMCRRTRNFDSAGGPRVAGSLVDGDLVEYNEQNGYENECVSPRRYSFVAESIHGRAAEPGEYGGGRRKKSYTKKKPKRKVSKRKISKRKISKRKVSKRKVSKKKRKQTRKTKRRL